MSTRINRFSALKAKTWLDHGGGFSPRARAPGHVSAAGRRSGCSSAEPYPLACQSPFSGWERRRQASVFLFSRSSISRYCCTSRTLHWMA